MPTTPVLHVRRPASSVEPLESRITPGAIAFPSVVSINRQTPATADTAAGSVVFKVTFSENVTGVDATDFQVFTSVDAKANPAVTVAGTGKSYNVTVDGLQGNGDVRLDLVDDNSIGVQSGMETLPLGGFSRGDGSFTGQSYRLLQTGPQVVSIATVGPATTEATSVSWKVTFSEAVTGVDATDFQLLPSAGVMAPNPITVTPVSATVYTVSTTGLGGSGTIGLNLVDDETIRDADHNPLRTNPVDFPKANNWSAVGNVSAVATGDVNGDGHLDFVVTNEQSVSGVGSVSVFLGNGDGTFQAKRDFSTGAFPRSVAVADVNGDGRPDLAVTGSASAILPGAETAPITYTSTTVSVLLGNGDGTFQAKQDYGSGYGHRAVAVGDLNGDGRPDLVVTNYDSGASAVNVMLGNGNGTFQTQQTFTTGKNPRSVAVGDVNGDGKADVVTGNADDNTVSVLLGTGTGALGAKTDFATGNSPRSVALADVSGDGKLDIVAANYGSGSNSVSVLLGAGNGSFGTHTTFTTNAAPSGVAVADYNGDGKLDLAVSHAQAPALPAPGDSLAPGISATALVSVLLGNGNGTFQAKQDFPGGTTAALAIAAADFDGDGRADLATANGFFGSASTLENGGNGDFAGPLFSIGVVAPDLAILSISDGRDDASPGDLLTYSIAYKNLSTKAATGAQLSVVLPDELNFVAAENPGWTLTGNILTKTIAGKVAGGKSGKVKLKLHVDETFATAASSVTAKVSIADDGTNGEDFDLKNNTGSDTDTLDGVFSDFTITGIDDNGLAHEGGTTIYKIHFANAGTLDDVGSITVNLPAETTFAALESSPGWTDNMDGTFTITGLDGPAGGAEDTVVFAVDADTPRKSFDPLELTATVSGDETDADLTNNSDTEDTPFYSGIYVTSPGVAVGGKFAPPVIRVFDRATGIEAFSFLAYPKDERGKDYLDSIRVAVADMNGDGFDDIITTTQHNGGRLRVFDGLTGAQFSTGPFAGEITTPFDSTKTGAFVAAGDLNGDGHAEIVVGSALGGGRVKVYTGFNEFGSPLTTVQVLKDFMPFDEGTKKFKGGVRVAVADVDGPTLQPPNVAGTPLPLLSFQFTDDLIVGMGYNGGEVKVYQGISDTIIGKFSVGGKGYKGGVSVAAGLINDDGKADLIVGRNSGKPSIVEVFDSATLSPGGTLPALIGKAINPFDSDPLHPKNTYGVRVAAVDINLDGIADIITSVGVKNGSQVKIYDGKAALDGTYQLLADRTITAYEDYPNVALWVAGSRPGKIRLIPT